MPQRPFRPCHHQPSHHRALALGVKRHSFLLQRNACKKICITKASFPSANGIVECWQAHRGHPANFFRKVWRFQKKSVTLLPKGTNSLCYSKMRTQVLDGNRNVLAEYEAKVSSHPRARIVRVKYMKLDGPRHKMEVVPWSAVFPKM